jgi:hypothetical protein
MKDAASGTIDLAWAGTDADGTQVYAPPFRAMGMQLGRGSGWLLMERPRETLNVLALGSVAGACLYLAREAITGDTPRKPSSRRRRRTKRR